MCLLHMSPQQVVKFMSFLPTPATLLAGLDSYYIFPNFLGL